VSRAGPPKVVLTGGPGAGKTVISAALAAAHPLRFVRVPEAATQVYTLLGKRWDQLDPSGRRDVQRRIYQLQIEQEDRHAELHPGKTLLLDRGTIDGAAYWPEGPEAYWSDLGTTYAQELARYDQVLLLQTAAAIGVYDGDGSNACRFEDAAGAVASGELLARLWGGHQRIVCIEACGSLEEKTLAVHQFLHLQY
jgi:predicted ATPase